MPSKVQVTAMPTIFRDSLMLQAALTLASAVQEVTEAQKDIGHMITRQSAVSDFMTTLLLIIVPVGLLLRAMVMVHVRVGTYSEYSVLHQYA